MAKKVTQEELEKLIEEADRLFSQSPGKEESRRLYVDALKKAKRMRKKLEAAYIQGKIDVIDQKWENAIESFDEAIRFDAVFSKGWCYKAWALNNLGRSKEALECCNEALVINSKYADSWYNKSCALRDLGRYEGALECSSRGLEINPKDADAWNNKGVLLSRVGRYEEALECYDSALEINPKDADAWNNKGVLLSRMSRYEEALECYDSALEINPKHELARANRNLVLARLGRFEEAEEERKRLYIEKKMKISKLKIPKEEKNEINLEIDADYEVKNELGDKYVEIIKLIEENRKKLDDSKKPRDAPLADNFFLVLRRWNSYTPVMLTFTDSNLGGGYFLHWNGKGIVIDPGFDFFDNFFREKLIIYDIDAVIITHAHVDHCSDFESLLTLIFEYNEENEKKKKIDVFMNLGAMKKFLGWIPIEEGKENGYINRVYPLERGIQYDLEEYSLRLKVTKAIHDEILSKTYSVGLIFELYDENTYTRDNPFKIGYTSDTKHDEDIEEQYKGVNMIIPHLGSIKEKNDFILQEKKDENHLLLKGTISTIYRSQARLAIVSEFGEELGEHRMTIIGALNRVFQRNNMARCLTGDIGLRASIPDLKVKCHYCKKYVALDEILEGIDPLNKYKKCVIYYCKNCKDKYEEVVPDVLDEIAARIRINL